MSGGAANRKKVNKSQGWELAGSEFYQESYPSNDAELHDVLQKDPKHLATLLPSKQNRAYATIRMRNTDTRTFRRQTSSKSRRESTVRRPSTFNHDVQVSMLPDLSEPMSNEQTTWEQIMQIKELPVSMSEKKQMKAKIQTSAHLRLQGYEQFKWKRKKVLQRFNQNVQDTLSKLELWRKDLKKIEGNFGTGVVAYFLFIKWLIFLNVCIFLLIFAFVILPTVVVSDDNGIPIVKNETVNSCSTNYFETVNETVLIMDIIQGTGRMERTIFFFGYYPNRIFEFTSEFYYSLPLSYVVVVVVILFVSLFAIVNGASEGFKERLVEGEGQFYQYCNLVFGGWDFCIHNDKSAAMKHKAIYNEIKGCLEAEKLEDEKKNRTREEKIKLVSVRVFVNFFELVVLVGSGAAIYFAFETSTDQRGENSNKFNALFYEFLPSITIVCLNIVVPLLFKFLVVYERYSPAFVIKITLIRTVFLRLASLIVLYASMYRTVSCELKETDVCFSDECNTQCWETFVGQTIYKLAITDFVTHIILTFFVNFPRSLIEKNCKSAFAKFIGEQNFDLPKHVLDIVYTQTLCWLGLFYAPMLPVMFVVIFFFMFYVKKFACLVNSKPSNVIHRASRSNSMFMIVLLVSYIVAVLPVVYTMAEVRPSMSCGPFRGLEIAWDVVEMAFSETPDWVQAVAQFLTTAFFTVPVFIVVILLLYYFTAVNSANRHMVRVLKDQLVLEGHDKQFLLERLSMFIKQQQETQKQLRRSEMMREGDRNVASN